MLIYQCLAQPLSEMLPPAVDVNKYKDTQTDNTEKGRDLGTLRPNWDVSIKSLPSGLR